MTSIEELPDLNESRSSKSSSLHSSYQSDNDGILSDISHFEDIGLDDERIDSFAFKGNTTTLNPYSSSYVSDLRTHVKKPPPRSPNMQRELLNSRVAPPASGLRGPVRGALGETGLGLMPTTMSRRGFTSPSTPSLTQQQKSRSPSPNTPSLLLNRSLRRGSWQSNRERKTALQLENECDEEDGDDVPDDVLLQNVPLSPRPIAERTISAPVSPKSPRSPKKKEKPRALGNGTPAQPVAQGTLRSPSSQLRSPSSPTNPGMGYRQASMGQFPINHGAFKQPRAKSWTAALSELSEEAKSLTQALEDHADEQTPKQQRNQSSTLIEKRRVQSAIAALPPLRIKDLSIDPLPISKEKEAVLSRTRPSWLPPKAPSEEKRHLKEYQRMMALSLKADFKREEAQRARISCKDDTASSLLRIWEEHVLPNWDAVISQKRTRELWWRGITPKNRGIVWQRAVGNELKLSETSYAAALKRAKASPSYGKLLVTLQNDVDATYPELRIFQEKGPLHQDIIDVCMAWGVYREDVGYVKEITSIIALLLLNLPTPSSTFITLCNLLNRPLPLNFLLSANGDHATRQKYYNLALGTLSTKFPILYNHLNGIDTSNPSFTNHGRNDINLSSQPDVYLSSIFTSILTSSLDLDCVTRLWDVWVFEGDAVLVRGVVALFASKENKLYGASTKEEVCNILRGEVEKRLSGGSATSAVAMDEEGWMRMVRDAGRGTKIMA